VVYELPFGKHQRFFNYGPLSYLIGGWSTNSIIDWSSGYPFSVSSGRFTLYPDVATNGNFSGNPTAIGGTVKGGSAVTYLSTTEKAQFSYPGLGDFGSGRNIFTGPGFFQMDFALHKTFPIKERIRFELRGEAFNVFNNVNFSQPNATLNSASFGVISSVRVPPRILQVAAKVSF
jgi:hypothetical protein